MKITMLTSVAGVDYAFTSGKTYDVNEKVAQDLIEAKHAKAAENAEIKPAPAKTTKKTAAKKTAAKKDAAESK